MLTLVNIMELLNQNDIVDVTTLMDAMDLTERKARNIMGKIKKMGKGYGFVIKNIQNGGYQLVKTDETRFEALCDAHSLADSDTLSMRDRLNCILVLILTELNGAVSLSSLRNAVSMSEKDIVSLLKGIRADLSKFDLVLNIEGSDVSIIGSEFDKRKFLVVLHEGTSAPQVLLEMIPQQGEQMVRAIIEEACLEHGVDIRFSEIKSLSSHLKILMMRAYQGWSLRDFYINMLLVDFRYDNISKSIAHAIKANFGLKLETEDINLIAFQLSNIMQRN